MFSPNLQAGLFYATAQSLNWLLGAASYFLLPSLGPIYTDPACSRTCRSPTPRSLQELLLDQRIDFLRDPAIGSAQSIARVRVAARLDLLHGRARRAPPRAGPLGADHGVGPGRPDDHVDDLPRVALRGGRHRRSGSWRSWRVVLARALTGFDARTPRRRRETAPARAPSRAPELPPRSAARRAIAAGPAVALVTLVVALITTGDVELPFRDPDHVAATYLVLVGPRGGAARRARHRPPRPRAVGERFPPSRAAMAPRAPRALDPGPRDRGRQRAARLLRDLHGLPQPQGRSSRWSGPRPSSTASSPTGTARSSAATTRRRCCTRCSGRASRRTSSRPPTSRSSSSCR